jgi:plastocyanin
LTGLLTIAFSLAFAFDEPHDVPLNAPASLSAQTGVCGDLNGDGFVNVIDVVISLQIVAGLLEPTASQAMLGDVHPANEPDGDNSLDDALLLLMHVIGQASIENCGAPVEVLLDIIDFTHQSATVPVGATVTWTNQDTVPHTTTAGTPPSSPSGEWNSGTMSLGQTFSHEFTEAGEFPYFCTIHPDMTGTITVE